MHKLAKGLKKKKKGKKSKHKEEELFKPEELEAYRREHASGEGSAKNEEWKNFLSLTSGVDDILKKTQDDLDRIKSTSFFQRIPPPSETKPVTAVQQEEPPQQSEEVTAPEVTELGIVQVSDSESEEEDDDDVFNTAYIDAIAAGEVKLAYIPDSPTEKQGEDDPFDTSIAERAILGPAVERKGKKLVPLGAAVEVLTGRVQLPTCATKPPSSRRQILKQRDLLLGSFDADVPVVVEDSEPIKKTLLDDDEIPLPDEPIDLSKTLYIPPSPQLPDQKIFEEFEENEEDKEFEALAAASLAKKPAKPTVLPLLPVSIDQDWKPFADEEEKFEVDDPFDTTFAQNILPGKEELKLIEKEILTNDVTFDPRAPEVSKLENRVTELTLNLIKPAHRDLLGGSTSDLSNLADKPIQPREEILYCDPFDTSIVDAVNAPGQAELKCLEQELLRDDFNPCADAKSSRPDVLAVGQSKSVSFLVPQVEEDDKSKAVKPLTPFYARKNSVVVEDPFDTSFVAKEEEEEEGKSEEIVDLLSISNDIEAKVLTPVAELELADPFDTSIATNLLPGKAELKLLESELILN